MAEWVLQDRNGRQDLSQGRLPAGIGHSVFTGVILGDNAVAPHAKRGFPLVEHTGESRVLAACEGFCCHVCPVVTDSGGTKLALELPLLGETRLLLSNTAGEKCLHNCVINRETPVTYSSECTELIKS